MGEWLKWLTGLFWQENDGAGGWSLGEELTAAW